MRKGSIMSIRAVSRVLLFCSVFFLVLAGGVSLYASAYVGELHRQTLAPGSSPSVRASLLRQIERSMGMRGAAGAFARYVQTGQNGALTDATDYLQTAEQLIGLYADHVPPGESDGAGDPADAGPGVPYDPACSPQDGTTNAMRDAPAAGEWFTDFLLQLIENANPPLIE